MKWIGKYIWICPFRELVSEAVHFVKWKISLSISRNGQFHTSFITYTPMSTTMNRQKRTKLAGKTNMKEIIHQFGQFGDSAICRILE